MMFAAIALLVVLVLVVVMASAYRGTRPEDDRTIREVAAENEAEPPEAANTPAGALPSPTEQSSDRPEPDATALLNDAETNADLPAVSRLAGEAGERLLAQGECRQATPLLQRSLTAALACRDSKLTAMARLRLGDLAHRNGDLTTACEHWQLARDLFTTVADEANAAAAEERMLETRCPTDWVLSDF